MQVCNFQTVRTLYSTRTELSQDPEISGKLARIYDGGPDAYLRADEAEKALRDLVEGYADQEHIAYAIS
jgi:hypothetical protein